MRAGRELGVGLVEDHEGGLGAPGRRLEQGFKFFRGKPCARGIVGQGDPHLPDSRCQGSEPGLQREARAHGYLQGQAPVTGNEQGIEAKTRVRIGDGIPRREPGQGHQIQDVAAGGAQHQPTLWYAQAPPQPIGELRLALGIAVEGHGREALQQSLSGCNRPVCRRLVHVQAGLPDARGFGRRARVRLDGFEIGSEQAHGFALQIRRKKGKDSPPRPLRGCTKNGRKGHQEGNARFPSPLWEPGKASAML